MAKTEPIKHHYIPQFIIRNFSTRGDGFVCYFDKKRKTFLNVPTETIFKHDNLYRDEINNPDNPTKIEEDFGKYEREISLILKERFLKGNDIRLTFEEMDAILLFLALMQFRSSATFKLFLNYLNEESKTLFKQYQQDGNYVDLWKRNLGYIVNCRSIKEVAEHPKIDDPFKMFMVRDAFGLLGQYLVVAERRGNEDFFLSDVYPLVSEGVLEEERIKTPLLMYFPISPSRIIIVVANGIEKTRKEIRHFDTDFLKKPLGGLDKNSLIIHVKKIYEKDICFINDAVYEMVKEGAVVADKERFFANERTD